jgi:hypothetical protein
VTFGSVVNPTTVPEATYYLRITTYSVNNWTGVIDTGTVAVSTADALTVSASVSESLTFCVGTSGANCGAIAGTAVTLAPNPLTTGSASFDGSARFIVATNAISGYVVSYNATTMASGGNTITGFPSSGTSNASVPGTEQFGFNLRDNATPNVGTTLSGGSGSCTSFSVYCTVDSFAYDTAGGISIASAAGPSLDTLFTLAYVANVTATTEPGTYTSTQVFVATAQF